MDGMEDTKKGLSNIVKQAKKTQREIDKLGKSFVSAGKTITKFLTLPLAAAGVAAVKFIDDATDLNETISKTNVIFGDSSKKIESWASTAASAMGQSSTQAMDAATNFAIFGKSAGLTGDNLVDFSTKFTGLASDMASFFNTSPEQAINAIGAAFRGEAEPIRKYGVLLDDASMRQEAVKLGIISTTKEALTPQNKILAAQALILKQTSEAQGDFARTSGGLANQKRILSAKIKDASASLGQIFYPIALDVVGVLTDLLSGVKTITTWFSKLSPEAKKTGIGFAVLLAAIGPATMIVGKIIIASKALIPLLVALRTGTLSWAGAMAALQGSALGVVAVITSLVAVGWYYYNNWDSIASGIKVIWEKLKLTALTTAQFIGDQFLNAVIKIVEMAKTIGDLIPGVTVNIDNHLKTYYKWKAAMASAVVEQIKNVSAAADQRIEQQSLGEAIEDTKNKVMSLTGATQEQTTALNDNTTAVDANKMAVEDEAAKRVEFEKQYIDQIREKTSTKLELLEYEKEQALLQAEELGASTYAIEELYSIKRKELADEEQEYKDKLREEEQQKNLDAIKSGLRAASSVGNKIISISNQFYNNAIKRIDNKHDKEIAAIESSTMSEEEKAAAIAKIDEETDKKKRKLAREQAKREKLAALFNIAINTASAIVEALPNIPLSIAVGVLGAIESVAVAAEPLPFYDGALIQGSEHGVNATVGERDQTELILPLETGAEMLADTLMDRIESMAPQAQQPQEQPVKSEIHLHVGTLVADKSGLTKLYRELEKVGVLESMRLGVV